MAADFPATKKTFSQLVDGTDYTEAAQVNQAYDEAEAIETLIGAMGRDQSYNTSIKAMLKNYRQGCACVYKSATELTVEVGEIYIPDASGNGAYRQNTSAVTVTWAMIDTGAEAGSTKYYLYARADTAATTFTVVISAHATAPTGLTYFRLIGSFYNDASSNILAESVDNNGMARPFGTWIDKSASYGAQIAYTDGFVVATIHGGDSNAVTIGYTDVNADPTTARCGATASFAGARNSFTMPVRKGDSWKVVLGAGQTVTYLYWIPA